MSISAGQRQASTFLVHIQVNWLSVAHNDLDELREFLPKLMKYVRVARKSGSKSRRRTR